MTRNQKIILALISIFYAVALYLIAYDGLLQFILIVLLFLMLYVGFIFLVAFAISQLTKEKISFINAFIGGHLTIIGVIAIFLLFNRFQSAFNFNSKPQIVHTKGTIEYYLDNRAKSYVRDSMVGDRHVFYFQTLRPSKQKPGNYFAHYYYNLGDRDDTTSIMAIRLCLNTDGEILETKKVNMLINRVAYDDFHKYLRREEAVQHITDLSNKHPQGTSGTIDPTTLSMVEELLVDSISIE